MEVRVTVRRGACDPTSKISFFIVRLTLHAIGGCSLTLLSHWLTPNIPYHLDLSVLHLDLAVRMIARLHS